MYCGIVKQPTVKGLTGIAATATYGTVRYFYLCIYWCCDLRKSCRHSEKSVLCISKDGNDANTGELTKPKLTIKGAVQKIIDEGLSDTVVRVAPGSYVEDNPIVLPNEVSVIGASLRGQRLLHLMQIKISSM